MIRRHTFVLFLMLMLAPLLAVAQQGSAPQTSPFLLEHTFWIKPGKTSQFIALFKKNRLPELVAEQAKGRIVWIRMSQPRISSGNDQWDFRITIGWRDAQTAWDLEDAARAVSNNRDALRQSIEETLSEELITERTDVPVQETTQ
ncbi:MAG: hypothetical protein ABIO61_10125 [Thermomonas sp.]